MSDAAPSAMHRLHEVLAELRRRQSQRLFYDIFPDEDTRHPDGAVFHSRHKYPRHMEFIAAGAKYRERAFVAANRIGKTRLGAFEVTAHLTGQYPAWWDGRRFDRPVRAWVAGRTNQTTRDIIQTELLGPVGWSDGNKGFSGTGMVPGRLIGKIAWAQGVSDLADTVKVQHVTGGWSSLGLKSYQQGRGVFEGTAQHVIWLDEECPADVYGECLVRTATTGGVVMLTFTPLEGLTEVVRAFMPGPKAA